jgi:TP901 family phage tail tape measure protein
MATSLPNEQIEIGIDLLLGKVNDKQLAKGLSDLANRVSEIAAKTSYDPTVKVDIKLGDEKKINQSVAKATKTINDALKDLAPDSEDAGKTVDAYREYFHKLERALSVNTAEYSKTVQANYEALASGNDRVLRKLGDKELAAAVRYGNASNLRNKLLKQALDSSASIFNRVGKEGIPVKPVAVDALDTELKKQADKYRNFNRFIKDSNVEARVQAVENRRYRQDLIKKTQKRNIERLGEDFNFSGVQRAYRKEIGDLLRDQESAPLKGKRGLLSKDQIGKQVQTLEGELKAVQGRYKILFGSTLQDSARAAEAGSTQAEIRYNKAKEQIGKAGLQTTERKVAETLAQKELTTALNGAYQVLKKLAPLGEKESKDAQDRVERLLSEKEALGKLVSARRDDARLRNQRNTLEVNAAKSDEREQKRVRNQRNTLEVNAAKSDEREQKRVRNQRNTLEVQAAKREEQEKIRTRRGTNQLEVQAAKREEQSRQRGLNQRNAIDVRMDKAGFSPDNIASLRERVGALGYRKGTISETLKGMVASNALGVDGAVADLQILKTKLLDVSRAAKDSGIPKLESEFKGLANAVGKAVGQVNKFDKRPPAEDFDAQVRAYRTRQARIEALGTARDALFTQVSSLRSMMSNAQTEGDIKTLRILLAEALTDVRRLGTESKKLGFEEGIDSARRLKKEISEVGDASKTTLKEIKGPTAAELRRAEKERIRAALIAQGEEAFAAVGGIRNYAKIGEGDYHAAQAYAAYTRDTIDKRRPDIVNDPNLTEVQRSKALKDLSKEFNTASKAANYLQAEINGNVGALRQIQLAARNFARYFIVYGGLYQVVGYFQQLARTLVDFQDSLKSTQVIAQATGRDMAGIGEAIRSVASESGDSLRNVAAAAETLAQAGTSVKDIPAALKAVSDFALATGSSMQVAADIITSAKEIFGEDLTFAGAADQLTRAVNISKLRAEDLRTIFNLGAQTAQSSGLSSAQFLGASATLSNLGIKSSTVATGLRQLLLELFNPDEKTIAFLRKRYNEIGERLSDGEIRTRFQGFQSSNNPLLEALGELRRLGAAGSGRDDFRRVLDIRAENVGLPLMQRLDELAKSIAQVSETGAAAAGAADRVNTLKKAIEQLGVKVQLLAEDLVGDLPKSLETLAKSIGDFIDRIRGKQLDLSLSGQESSIDKGTALEGGYVGYALARTRLGRIGSAAVGMLTGATSYLGGKAAEAGDGAKGEVVSQAVQGAAGIAAAIEIVRKLGQYDWIRKLIGLGGKVAAVAKTAETAVEGVVAAAEAAPAAVGILGRLGALLARFNPFIAVASFAFAAYELFDLLREKFKGPGQGANSEAVARALAQQQQQVGEAEAALKQITADNKSSIKAQADEVNKQVLSYSSTLQDIFGKNADEAAKMLEELGSVPLEAGTKRTNDLRARLEAKAPKGLDERKFAELSKARADFTAAQSTLQTLASQQLDKAAKIVREGQENMDESEKKFLEAIDTLKDSPLFKPGAFTPENLVQGLKDLFTLLNIEIKKGEKVLEDAKAKVATTENQQTGLDLRRAFGEGSTPDTRQQFDIFIRKATQNPTPENLAELQRIKAETAKYLQEQIAAAPKDAPIPQDMADRITNLEDVQKKVDEAIKTSSEALMTAEEKKKKADADAAEQKKIDEAKQKRRAAEEDAANLSEEELAILRNRLETEKDEWEEKVKLANKEKRWNDLLKDGGLIDKQYEARVKLAEAEQGLAIRAVRRAADDAGIALPKNVTDLSAKDRVLVKRAEKGPEALARLDQANTALATIKKTRDEAKASILESSKQVIPFTESVAYNDRQIEIRKLKERINDSEKESLSEMLSMIDQLYALEIANIQEEIDHVKSQKSNYGTDEEGQAKYKIALAKAEDRKADAISQLKRQRQAVIDRAEVESLKAEEKSVIAQQKLIVARNKQKAQAPETTRRGVQVLTGVPPQMGGVQTSGISPNAKTAYDYFIRKGLKPYQAAGIVGNLMQESYAQVEPTTTNSRGAVGIAQWLYPSRKAGLLSKSKPYDLQTQLDYIWEEYNTTQKTALRNMRSSGDLTGAVDSFLWDFENPGKDEAHRDKRLKHAQRVLAAMQGSGAAYGSRPIPAATPVSGGLRPRAWEEFKFIDRDGNGGGDVFGVEKFKQKAPQVYQAIIGGAMKWVEEQGGKSYVKIRDIGRGRDKGNHSMGYAGDVELYDAQGRKIPNLRNTGKQFRAYEQFWQDGLAYAMQLEGPDGKKLWGPELEKYFRHGGYFTDTSRDGMHGDVSMLYPEERKAAGYKPAVPAAGGNLREGAYPWFKKQFRLESQGIPNGDWNQYFADRFPGLASQMGAVSSAGPDYTGVLSGIQFPGGMAADEISRSQKELRDLDLQRIEILARRSRLDPNIDVGAESKDISARAYERDTKDQQRAIDSLRSGLEAQQTYLTRRQTEMLPYGPAEAAARSAAGLPFAPKDELTRLQSVREELDNVQIAAEEALRALGPLKSRMEDNRDQAQADLSAVNKQLEDAKTRGDEQAVKALEAKAGYFDDYLTALNDNLKGWDTLTAEFQTRVNESRAAVAANIQEQQNFDPSLLNREIPVKVVGPDGKVRDETFTQYGQLAQGFDAKAIAADLNELSYSLKNLGRNIRGFFVNVIDTFVSTVADRIVKGAAEVDTTALNEARANLYAAQADGGAETARLQAELRQYEDSTKGMDTPGIRARRAELQSTYAQSAQARSAEVNARQAQVKELEKQAEGPTLGDAFTGLMQEFSSQMLKTVLLMPFQGIMDKLGLGQRGSQANPMYVKDVDAPAKTAGAGGSAGGASTGGVMDSVLGPLKDVFYGIGDMFGGIFSTITGLFSSLGGGGGGGWGNAIGSIVGAFFAEGGPVGRQRVTGKVKGPGTGTSDSIPAWLSNGEYVLTAAEVQKIGVQNIEKWKSAMASPAKFAAGGLVQTFDTATRNPANYSNAGATGGSTDVTIIDQRSQASSEPVSVNRTRGPDNKEVIQIMVRDAVKNAINSGYMDRTMAANFGARRPGARR